MGLLEILNCGEGDMKVTFDRSNPMELERAKRIIQDMLRRGYSLFVHGEGDDLTRVQNFDTEKGEYLIADGPLYAGDSPQLPEIQSNEMPPIRDGIKPPVSTPKRRGRPCKVVPMDDAKVTAIGRSAGG